MKSSWKESYSIGLNVVDGQHKRLIGYFDELLMQMNKGVSHSDLQTTINSLKIYTRSHFATEERLMKQVDYPYIVSHMAEHLVFIERLLEFEARLAAKDKTISIELLRFLNLWILKHIKETDNKMIPFLIEHGIDNLNTNEIN